MVEQAPVNPVLTVSVSVTVPAVISAALGVYDGVNVVLPVNVPVPPLHCTEVYVAGLILAVKLAGLPGQIVGTGVIVIIGTC